MNDVAGFSIQDLPAWRRVVLKVGSSLLADGRGELSTRNALGLAQFVSASVNAGREVVLVSSGAVTAGRMLWARHDRVIPGRDAHHHAHRQAMAALGQTHTVALWQRLLDRPLAQILLTHDDLRNRRRYLNARATLEELLGYGAIPVVNENDTVAVDELTLGDNDNLAAIVAVLVRADLLLIATDIDGLYTANPRRHADAVAVNRVVGVTPDVLSMAAGAGSSYGTGGMRTKLEAASKAGAAGIDTILFNGRDPELPQLLMQSRMRGTHLCSTRSQQQARKHWLRHLPAGNGRIRVDAGAAKALCRSGASLLPAGIVDVEGRFERGDMIEVFGPGDSHPVARGLVQYGADDVLRIRGLHSDRIVDELGYSHGDTVIHRDDMVTEEAGKTSRTSRETEDE